MVSASLPVSLSTTFAMSVGFGPQCKKYLFAAPYGRTFLVARRSAHERQVLGWFAATVSASFNNVAQSILCRLILIALVAFASGSHAQEVEVRPVKGGQFVGV